MDTHYSLAVSDKCSLPIHCATEYGDQLHLKIISHIRIRNSVTILIAQNALDANCVKSSIYDYSTL
ncbi:hypothetical protein SAMN05216504_3588 [Pseudomonas sp. A214]|nr:hypothetical protein SAMN05216504_3588 [Pseudomonas sp. A214]